MRKCPFCAEEIQDAAIKCRHCGSALDAAGPQPSTPVRRFQNVTESDARLLPEGALIELQPGGRISPRVEGLLTSRHVTVRRIAVEPPTNSSSSDTPKPERQTSLGLRHLFGILAVGAGLLLAFVSPTLAGMGFFMMWFGLGSALNGSTVARWGGGFVAALILGSIGMAIGSPSRSASAAASATQAHTAAAGRPSARPSVPRSSCLKIDTFDSSVLSSNDVFTELAWKVDVINSCDESFSARVVFTISDKDDFELDTDREDIIVPANGTGNARGKMLVNPPEKARRMAKQGASVRLR